MKKLFAVFMILLLAGCRDTEISYDMPQGAIINMEDYGIADSRHFYFATYETVFDLIENKATTIVYIGHEGCPWCEALVPELDGICEQFAYDLYYLDSFQEENMDKTDELQRLAEICKEFVTPDKEGNPVIWAPSIIYIQKGKVIAVHEGTVNTHDARERDMTEKEVARLRYILEKEFKKLTEK